MTMIATAQKRTMGTIKRGLEVIGADKGEAVAFNWELKIILRNVLYGVFVLTLLLYFGMVKMVWWEVAP